MLTQRKIVPQMVEDYTEFIENLITKDNKVNDDNSIDNDNDNNVNKNNDKNKTNNINKDLIISNNNENTKLSQLLKTIDENKCNNNKISPASDTVNQSSVQCNDNNNTDKKKKRIIIIKKGKKPSDCENADKNKCVLQEVIEKAVETASVSQDKEEAISHKELRSSDKDNEEVIDINKNKGKDKEIDINKNKDNENIEEVDDKEDKSFIEIQNEKKDEKKDEKTFIETKHEFIEEKNENVEIVLNPILQTLMYNRSHHFVTKTIIPKEMCDICGESFNFSEKYVSCIDCLSICHLSCNSRIPLPCIPYTIPNKFKSKSSKEIADYVYPAFKPSIPLILIRCCHEIEMRCQISRTDDLYLMNSEGLKQVKDLCERIMKKKNNILVLDSYNVNFVCGVVKKFLDDLNEPLVSKELWKQFSLNARKKSEEEVKSYVKQLVMELRTSNRDTLAFMILHLLNIAANQKYLSLINLAEIFCPIICGDTEVSRKLKLMTCLLEIECEFWLSLIFKSMF